MCDIRDHHAFNSTSFEILESSCIADLLVAFPSFRSVVAANSRDREIKAPGRFIFRHASAMLHHGFIMVSSWFHHGFIMASSTPSLTLELSCERTS